MERSKLVWVLVAVLGLAMLLIVFRNISSRRDADDDRGRETAVEKSETRIAADI